MRRFGQVIGIDPAHIDDYIDHHQNVFPEVLAALTAAEVRNYSIFLDTDLNLLFAYMEYHGPDAEFEDRMAEVGRVSTESGWWALTGAMQRPLESRSADEWWKNMREVFHLD